MHPPWHLDLHLFSSNKTVQSCDIGLAGIQNLDQLFADIICLGIVYERANVGAVPANAGPGSKMTSGLEAQACSQLIHSASSTTATSRFSRSFLPSYSFIS